MAKQITDLAGLTVLDDLDLILTRDVSAGIDKKMLGSDLKSTIQAFLDSVSAFVFPGQIVGLELSNSGGDPLKDIDIAPGRCSDSSATYHLVLGATLTKQLDAAWAEGTNLGGLFSGAIAATTWYHVFLIRKDSDGTIDAGFDTDPGAANIPVGWTAYRRLGSILTDGTPDIVPFHQYGDRFIWDTTPNDVSTALSTANRTAFIVTCPPNVLGLFQGNLSTAASIETVYAVMSSSDQVDVAAASTNATILASTSAAVGLTMGAPFECRVDGSSQINSRGSAARQYRVNTIGWIDTRGKYIA